MVRGPRLCRRRSFFPHRWHWFRLPWPGHCDGFHAASVGGTFFSGPALLHPCNVCEGARAANLFLDFGPRSKEPQGWVSDVLVPVVAFTRGHPEHAVPRGGRVEARFETLPMVLLESSLQSREVFCSTPVFGRGQEVPDLGVLPHKIAEAVAIQVECGLGHDCFALGRCSDRHRQHEQGVLEHIPRGQPGIEVWGVPAPPLTEMSHPVVGCGW